MDVKELLENVPMASTKFELTNFVIGSMDSPARIIKQIAIESEVRMNNIKTLERDKKRNVIKTKQLQESMEHASGYNKELIQLDIEEIEDNDIGIKNKLERNQFELDVFQEILDKLELRMGVDEIKRLSSIDGQEEEESAYWLQRLSKQASADVISTGRIQRGNMEAILNLPTDMQRIALKMTEAKSNNFENSIELENESTLKIDETSNITDYITEKDVDGYINKKQFLEQKL